MSLRSREASPEEHNEYLMMTWKRWGVNCWTVEASLNKLWETEIVKQDKAKKDGNFVYFVLFIYIYIPLYWCWRDCGCLYRYHIFCECDICQISNTLRDFLVVYLNSRMNLSEFVVVSCEGHDDLTKHIFDLLCDSMTGELLFVSSQHVKIPRDNPDRGRVFKSV